MPHFLNNDDQQEDQKACSLKKAALLDSQEYRIINMSTKPGMLNVCSSSLDAHWKGLLKCSSVWIRCFALSSKNTDGNKNYSEAC